MRLLGAYLRIFGWSFVQLALGLLMLVVLVPALIFVFADEWLAPVVERNAKRAQREIEEARS